MSGGSYNYLHCKDTGDTLNAMTDLSEMADCLDREFPGSAAARDTRALYEELRELQRRWEDSPLFNLRNSVWFAVEWWQSCDRSRESAEEAVRAYGDPGYRPVPGVLLHCLCGAHVQVVEDDDGRWHYAEHPRRGDKRAEPCGLSGWIPEYPGRERLHRRDGWWPGLL
jgi:hypothetical protein